MRQWQDVDYVLGHFGKKVSIARGRYPSYVEAGVSQGRRNDLVGGGLIRSLGGWAEVEGEREKVGYRIKGDERILGGSDFVSQMLAEAQEQFEQRYRLRSMGYDLKKVADKVAEHNVYETPGCAWGVTHPFHRPTIFPENPARVVPAIQIQVFGDAFPGTR